MNLKFKEFQKQNLISKELDILRNNHFKKFQAKGLPSKKQEEWKYTDLKTIISNNFNNLEILNKKKKSQYGNKFLIDDLEHNSIVMCPGYMEIRYPDGPLTLQL